MQKITLKRFNGNEWETVFEDAEHYMEELYKAYKMVKESNVINMDFRISGVIFNFEAANISAGNC